MARGDTPLWQVGLGPDNYAWYLVHTTEIDNFVVHDLHHLERLLGRDGVDENVAVDADGMLGIKDCVLVLQRIISA